MFESYHRYCRVCSQCDKGAGFDAKAESHATPPQMVTSCGEVATMEFLLYQGTDPSVTGLNIVVLWLWLRLQDPLQQTLQRKFYSFSFLRVWTSKFEMTKVQRSFIEHRHPVRFYSKLSFFVKHQLRAHTASLTTMRSQFVILNYWSDDSSATLSLSSAPQLVSLSSY